MPQKHTIKDYAADAYYHVFARGINKQPIFLEAADYHYFIGLFERYLSGERMFNRDGVLYPDYAVDIKLIAFCLMRNHIHLLLYQQENPLAIRGFMSSLLTSYSKYFNKKYRRSGSLFESRYKARHIHDESYLSHISRYIHMNPRRWQFYRYSSLSAYLKGSEPVWLDSQSILGGFKKGEYLKFLLDYQSQKNELEQIKQDLADN